MTDPRKALDLIQSKGSGHVFGEGYHITQDEHDLLISALQQSTSLREQLEANAAHIGDLLDVHDENAKLRARVGELENSLRGIHAACKTVHDNTNLREGVNPASVRSVMQELMDFIKGTLPKPPDGGRG